MFEASRMLFIYVETPLHAGTGRGLGAVDLPIQRERTTGYPIVQGSSVKGCLRGEARAMAENGDRITHGEVKAIFGPEGNDASEHAGALCVADAKLLLFPVRSLAGVFAWATSRNALARFEREAAIAGLDLTWRLQDLSLADNEAWVSGGALLAGDSIVLEEFSFEPRQEHADVVRAVGEWLADHALPRSVEYSYWRAALPRKLCILPEDAFRDFTLYSTEVQTHVKLDPQTKTVITGALWTAESLPTDTILYAPLMATGSRANGTRLTAQDVLQKIADLGIARTQLGGDETTGQGIVSLRIAGGAS